MGYNIKIGNAVPHVYREDGEATEFGWLVEDATHPEAPQSEPNSGDASGDTNGRYPGYIGFAELMDRHGLRDLFTDKNGGLFRNHPGIEPLHKHHLLAFEQAIAKHRHKYPNAVPHLGPDGEPMENVDLFKLEWYAFWMRWALTNCENPAISNG